MIRAIFAVLLAIVALPSIALAEERDEVLPQDFQGQIAYFGNYTGKTSVTTDAHRRETTPCPYKDHRCFEQIVGGGIKVVLTFDGDHVTGFYVRVGGFTGPNGLADGSLIGRRTETGCELYEADGTMWLAANCGRRDFRGQIASVRGIPKQSEVSFSTIGMYVRDTSWIEDAEHRDHQIEWLTEKLRRPGSAEMHFRAAAELDSFGITTRGIESDHLSAPQVVVKRRRNKEWALESNYARGGGNTDVIRGTMYEDEVRCLSWNGGPCQPVRAPLAWPNRTADDDGGWLSRSPAPIIGAPITRN